MDTREILNNEIYPRLTAKIIFGGPGGLDGCSDQQKGIVATCPECGQKGHFFCYHESRYGKCHSGRCDLSRKALSWWDYTAKRYGLTKNQDILRKLAELAGVLHVLEQSKQKSQQICTITTVEDTMKLIHQMGQWAASKMPQEFTRYLADKRGFDQDLIKKSGLMYMERDPFIKALFSKGATTELLRQTGILTKRFGEEYRLILPYPNENGGYYGFVGRLNYNLTPDDEEMPKYKNGLGTAKDIPFLFHAANKPGNNRMLVVETPFDAHVINNRCKIKGAGAIALCGSSLKEQALTAVNQSEVPIVVLALDDDEAGHLSTMTLILNIKKRVFVVTDFKGYKDPGDLIAAKGPDRFNECLKAAIPATVWIFRNLYSGFRAMGQCGRIEKLSEIAPLYQGLGTREDKMQFLDEARKATLLHESDIRAAVAA